MLRVLFVFFSLCISVSVYAQSSFYTYLDRCQDLRPQIEAILEEEGLPTYFFYLALAESGCKPDNLSHKNAKGLYQLVPRTFMVYSIGVCYPDKPCPKDMIYDPIISARVAAKYLKSLYDRFDHSLDWTIAAYNVGGTNLKRKMKYVQGMNILKVKNIYPQAYNLAMKVKRFSKLDPEKNNPQKNSY